MTHTGDAHCWCLWSPLSQGLLCSPAKQGEVCAAPRLLVPREMPCGFLSEVGELGFPSPICWRVCPEVFSPWPDTVSGTGGGEWIE